MQLTTQITLQRAGEDGLKSPRITHQQPASDNYTSVADVHFFFLSILKNGSKWVFVQMFKGLDLQPHMENCEETHWAVTSLFMKAATVESALQALPWYQGLTVLFFFLFVCLCGDRRELGCIRNSAPTCWGSLKEKKRKNDDRTFVVPRVFLLLLPLIAHWGILSSASVPLLLY